MLAGKGDEQPEISSLVTDGPPRPSFVHFTCTNYNACCFRISISIYSISIPKKVLAFDGEVRKFNNSSNDAALLLS